MKSGVLSSFLFIWVGLCLSGVLPDGVWSEWGYAQWGFVCLPGFWRQKFWRDSVKNWFKPSKTVKNLNKGIKQPKLLWG